MHPAQFIDPFGDSVGEWGGALGCRVDTHQHDLPRSQGRAFGRLAQGHQDVQPLRIVIDQPDFNGQWLRLVRLAEVADVGLKREYRIAVLRT